MIIVHWFMIVGCWQVPNRSMVKAARVIRKQANLIARVLNGRDNLHQVVHEITQGVERCRQNTRRAHPNLSQLLLASSLEVEACLPEGILPSQFP